MRRIVIGMAVVLLAAAGCGSQSYPPYPPTISVNGIGTAYAEPEMAVISFGFNVTESDPETAVEAAAELAETAIEAAVEAGVPRESITTTAYSLWIEDEYDYVTYEYTGNKLYHLDHSMQVKTADIEQVGALLATLVGGGANTVYSVQFTVEDRAALYAEARELALEDAAQAAGQLASTLNVRIIGVQSVSEWVDTYANGYAESYTYSGDGAYPPVEGGSQSITLNVNVAYTIEQ